MGQVARQTLPFTVSHRVCRIVFRCSYFFFAFLKHCEHGGDEEIEEKVTRGDFVPPLTPFKMQRKPVSL